MLSNKMTFSLTSFLVLLAFGLAFVPSAMGAEWWEYAPEVNISVADVSSAPGNQVEAYQAGSFSGETAVFSPGTAKNFMFYIKVTKGQASLDNSTANSLEAAADGTANADRVPDKLDILDLSFTLYDKDGVKIAGVAGGHPSLLDASSGSKIEHVGDADGKNFKVTIVGADFANDDHKAAAILVNLPAGSFKNVEPAAVSASLTDVQARPTGKNKKHPDHNHAIILVPNEKNGDPVTGPGVGVAPKVVSTVRIVSTASAGVSRFQTAAVSGPFQVRITLTEEGKDFADKSKNIISVVNGKVTSIVPGVPFKRDPTDTAAAATIPDPDEGNYAAAVGTTHVPDPTGRDMMYHPYLVTIDPDLQKKGNEQDRARNVEIRVQKFEDMMVPANSFVPPTNLALAKDRSLLEVPINTGVLTDVFATATKDKPANEKFIDGGLVIPKGGYLILTQGTAGESGVTGSPAKLADKKLAAQKLYNVKNEFTFPAPGNDLAAFFRAGGTIRLLYTDVADNKPAATDKANENGYLLSNTAHAAGDVVISEIMWGRDLSLRDAFAHLSQWIELHNTTGEDISIDPNEWTLAFYQGSGGAAGADLIDEVSNASPYWAPFGSNGATKSNVVVTVGGDDDTDDDSVVETFDLETLSSMYRKIDGTTALSGTSAESWAASPVAGTLNLSGLRAGTPGADNPTYTAPVVKEDPPPPTVPTDVAAPGDIMITEIMVASNGGRLPQWVELTNKSTGVVTLKGWSLIITNDPMDSDVVGGAVSVDLGDVEVGVDKEGRAQSVLVVSKKGRSSGEGTGAGDLRTDRIIDVQSQVSPGQARYMLISETAFTLTLVAPPGTGVRKDADVVGNLGMGWEVPMAEGNRSSIIRREMDGATEINGTDAAGWKLASDSMLDGAYRDTYYGQASDVGTPGYDAGGALPVELSKFSAARDRATGQVTIAWETQSELNNAGFFIKRSQQRDGQFQVVNPTMIAGAGTTSEKQSYTYTDTTAQPNIVYYYQIEDVSLDGNRQTLTRSHRLKGHIGAAGKATTTWGELKEQQ